MRSRLCVRQLKAEGIRSDLFAGTLDTFFIKYLLAKAPSCKEFGVLVVDSLLKAHDCCIKAQTQRFVESPMC